MIPQLIRPHFPEALGDVWTTFCEVSGTRPTEVIGNQIRMRPIPYTELKVYMDLMGIVLSPREVKVLKQLDSTYLKVMNG